MKIKNILLASCLILAVFRGESQSVSPRDEFKVSISKSQIRLSKGGKDSVELTVIRAKHFKGTASFRIASALPEEVSTKISPLKEKPDHFIMYLQTSDTADDLKDFYVIPSCTIQGKSKGVTIKVIVSENLISETK